LFVYAEEETRETLLVFCNFCHLVCLQLWEVILPEEKGDEDNAMLEVEAGVGGQEAMLFTSKVFHMYEKYAAFRNWTFNILEYNTTELGGMRLACASVVGPGSYKLLKYEGGVHRVQRVPQTDRHGRVHTSTMSVVVLPQPSEIKLHIDPKDLRIETKRSRGPGGQHVNTTESAVRITHLPSGIVCESQRDRSQLRNRDYAMAALRAKLYGRLLHQEQSALQSARKLQVDKGKTEKTRMDESMCKINCPRPSVYENQEAQLWSRSSLCPYVLPFIKSPPLSLRLGPHCVHGRSCMGWGILSSHLIGISELRLLMVSWDWPCCVVC
uniref:Mitochondrial translational release factor 1-like n=1 Tax=Eptatretus burgeri TaxID=7764 RepID=A0A8C4Q1R6_EPTBU